MYVISLRCLFVCACSKVGVCLVCDLLYSAVWCVFDDLCLCVVRVHVFVCCLCCDVFVRVADLFVCVVCV